MFIEGKSRKLAKPSLILQNITEDPRVKNTKKTNITLKSKNKPYLIG